MSFRKERKFRLTSSDALVLREQLVSAGMSSLHPKRKITSQYFDTPDHRSFTESEEGVVPRYKIRVRWYNDAKHELTKERKTSSMEGRYKTSVRVSQAEFQNFKVQGICDRDYGMVYPSVLISYNRSYFQHREARITFDTDIHYQFGDTGIAKRDFDEVVEIKVPYESTEGYLDQLIDIPTSRFSKYGRAFLIQEGLV